MYEEIVENIRRELKEKSVPQVAETSSRFFKAGEKILVHGVRMAEVSKIGKSIYREIEALSKESIFEICEELWKSKYIEEEVIACIFSESLHEKYEPADFNIFEHWLKDYVNNWADCDTLCNHTIGTFMMMYPSYVEELKRWAKTSYRWQKRGSAVTLIIPARKGLFLKEILEIADILLLDQDDLVQKGYGWMLKAAGESHQKEIFEYVMSKKAKMPRTALRYAIEKMPKELKSEAMKK